MEILVVLGLGFLVTGLVVGLAVRSQRYRRALQDRAAARGWTWHDGDGPVAWAIEGQQGGLPWRVECRRVRRSGQTGGGTTTRFEASVPTPRVLMTGPKLPAMLRGVDPGSPLLQRGLRLLVGDGAELLATARLQPVDGPFGELYDILTTDPDAAALLDDEAREVLRRFAETDEAPAVTCWQDRLVVRVSGGVDDPDRLERLVGLGRLLLRKLRP